MKNICKKSIVISIILLLVGVSVSSALSVDTKSTISNNKSKECRECNEISDSDLIRVERLLNRVEVYSKLLLVLSRYNPKLREISGELYYEISFLKEEFTNDRYPLICNVLETIVNILDAIFTPFWQWAYWTDPNTLEGKIADLCWSILFPIMLSTLGSIVFIAQQVFICDFADVPASIFLIQ